MYRILLSCLLFVMLLVPFAAVAGPLVDGSGEEVIADVTAGDIPQLVSYLGDDDAKLAENSAAMLREFGSEAVPELVKALGDDKKVIPALNILTSIADKDSAESIARLITDQREGVAGRARFALAKIGDPAVGPLVELIGKDDYTKAAFAALKLIRNASESSKETVRGLITSDDKAVRVGAIDTLGLWKDDGIVEDMPKLLSDPDPDVRFAAVNAYRLATKDYDVKTVAALLKDPSDKVRQAAATIMTFKPDEYYVEPLIEAYKAEKDGMTRSVLLGALGEMGDNRAKPYLLEGLSDTDPNVVVSSLWYIDDYKMLDAVPVVVKLFSEKSPVTEDKLVVREALRSLGNLGENVDLGPFLPYITNKYDIETRMLALKMIAATGTSGDKAAIDAVNGMIAGEMNAKLKKLGEKALESLK